MFLNETLGGIFTYCIAVNKRMFVRGNVVGSGLIVLIRTEAAVDVDNLPGNKTCLRRNEPSNRVGNVSRFSPTLE